jgi:DNA repair exonuclease SbcCD nuclease subunit
MRIALISDTHWGVRNDSPIIMDHLKTFLNETFFPKLEAEGIKTIIHLGDLVDRRKYINYVTATRLRQDFLDVCKAKGIKVYVIAGNHDTYYKNTNEINALRELVVGKYDNVFVYSIAPSLVMFDDTPIVMLPWLCSENKDESLKFLNETKAPIVMAHLELAGFEMYRGNVSHDGDDPKIFDKFDIVCTGHYHTRSSRGNIHYLGTPVQYVWSDFGDDKGFHILDTKTRELTFYQNPKPIFYKFFYDDLNKQMDEVLVFDSEQYKNCYVKVIIKNKTNPLWFDNVIDRLEKSGVVDLQVVEDHLNLNLEADEDIVSEAEDTSTILRNYIQSMTINTDKKRVEDIVNSLYAEALTIE